MDVRIVDYGENADGGFISYNISGLSQNQLEFLNNNLDDETQITNDNLILKTKLLNSYQMNLRKSFSHFKAENPKSKLKILFQEKKLKWQYFYLVF